MKKLATTAAIMLALLSCNNTDMEQPDRVEHSWEFTSDAEGWTGDFADYPVGAEESYELLFEHDSLPEPLDGNQGALKLSGTNHSDDLFMFIKKKVTGLEPNMVYYSTFIVEFATNIPDGLAGIGGSPGESVYLKVGATPEEPDKEVDENDYYRMNIDKSNQSQGGDDMVVIGDFSNDTDEEVYTLKTLSNESSFGVKTNEKGEAWIIVGTDSGFEGTTNIYYNSIQAEFY